MIKRLTWFLGGAVAGAAGSTYARRKVKAAAAQLAPTNVARSVARTVTERVHDLGDAVREGRMAMRAKERELRARRDGAETVIVDGTVLDVTEGTATRPGQVIVLREPGADTARSRPARRSL